MQFFYFCLHQDLTKVYVSKFNCKGYFRSSRVPLSQLVCNSALKLPAGVKKEQRQRHANAKSNELHVINQSILHSHDSLLKTSMLQAIQIYYNIWQWMSSRRDLRTLSVDLFSTTSLWPRKLGVFPNKNEDISRFLNIFGTFRVST